MTGSDEQHAGFASPDLAHWQDWSRRQRRAENVVRRVRSRGRRLESGGSGELILPAGKPRVLVVVDHTSPSCLAAVVEPLRYLDRASTAVLVRKGDTSVDIADGARRVSYEGPPSLPASIRSILSLGGYLALSQPLVEWARERSAAYVLVQHGLLTPYSPPAPQGSRVLAWSEADAEFWGQGRPDVDVTVTGSQMLWNAGRAGEAPMLQDQPVVLGQLHGSELSRRDAFFAYWDFCRTVPSEYRPHPNESDAISRGLHAVMQRGGISFESSGTPLPQLGRPVVSIFSTGTLEAAMRGLPAWVYHPEPPSWVRDFWARYELAPYGSTPTKPWSMPRTEPALAVANALEGLV